MKLTTSLLVTIASLLPLISAVPAPLGTGITTTISTNRTLVARKVPEYKAPWSYEGTCNSKGACAYDNSGSFPARCKNSKCDTPGGKCIVAYSDTTPTDGTGGFAAGKEAKCPTNTAGYDWEWPWIDHAWQDAWNTYKQCKSDAKSIKDKEARYDAMAKCDEMQRGPA